jgi:hypothetical protein
LGCADVERIEGGLVAPLAAAAAVGDDDLHGLETIDGLQEGLFAEAYPPIESASITCGDAVQHLREADGIAGALEAECAPHDVEQDLELPAREFREQVVKQLIGDLRVIRAVEALEKPLWFLVHMHCSGEPRAESDC